jgi:hypothetical protein
MERSEDARIWLRQNGYDDVAAKIDRIIDRWQKEGKATRRNWWDILAGGRDGRPRSVAGVEFPVLRAAQKRKGLPVTPNAVSRNRKEKVPSVRISGRWPQDAAAD